MNSTIQRDAAILGFESIPLLVHRYQLIENLRRPDQRRSRSHENLDTALLIDDLENKIVQLYRKILEYQIRLTRQYSYAWALRFGRDVIKADDWAKMLADLKLVDDDCSRIAGVLGQDELERSLTDNNHRIDDGVYRLQLSLQNLQTDVNEISTTVHQQIQDQKARKLEERAQECLQLFRIGNRYEDQKNRIPHRHPNTCCWFLDNSKFHEWKNKDCSSLLWVSANPGCGKSVLSRSLVDEGLLNSDVSDVTICYFFFKDISIQSRSITTALAAIIHQLCSKKPCLLEHAVSSYQINGSELSNLFDAMWDILATAAADPRAGEIICILDALDECEQSQQFDLIEKVKNFYSAPQKIEADSVKLRFLLTSRPYRQITARFHKLVYAIPTIHLSGDEESEQISQEIEQVMRAEVAAIASERFFDAEAEKFLLDQLLGIQNRTYLWLHLILDQIRNSDQASNPREIRRQILSLPQSISAAYEGILARTTDRDLATKLLHIIIGAEKPMTVKEMNVAISIEDDSKSYEDLQLESDEGFTLRIRNVCGLFIDICQSMVYLIHQTAKDFLIRQQGERDPIPGVWRHSLSMDDSHTIIAKVCQTFLLFNDFQSPSVDLSACSFKETTRYCEEHPFFEYASRHWIKHSTELLENGLPPGKYGKIACLFDVECPRYRNWTCVYRREDTYIPLNATSVVLACYFKSKPLLQHFIRTCSDVNHQDSDGMTALDHAVCRRDIDMVRILLENGADVQGGTWDHNSWREMTMEDDEPKIQIQTVGAPPIVRAAAQGNLDMIQFLVDHGASVDARDADGKSALHISYEGKAMNGIAPVQVLLDCGADVNLAYDARTRNRSPKTLSDLSDVSLNTGMIHEPGGVLDMDFMPDQRSLLLLAVYEGDAPAVGLFLKYGANPKFSFTVGEVDQEDVILKMDNAEDSADHRESITEMLGEQIREPFEDCSKLDSHLASQSTENADSASYPLEDNAFEDFKRSLIQVAEITLTHFAVIRYETQILATLLSYGHYDKIIPSDSDQASQLSLSANAEPTLLHIATILGYTDVAAVLLDAQVVDINAKDHEGETALDKAMKYGRDGVIDLLMEKFSRFGR